MLLTIHLIDTRKVFKPTYAISLVLPRRYILPHSRSLHQAEGSNLVEGGWVRGDAWFGPIESCVQLKSGLGCYSLSLSNLILSNNPVWILHVIQSQSEPFLHSLPKATNEVSYHYLSVLLRCVSHLVGYWVVMTATISDVPLYVMVNTWSSRKFHFVVGL